MSVTVRENHHTPLDKAAAKKLVEELEAALIADEFDDVEGPVSDDIAFFVDQDKPPTAEQAKKRAKDTGYAEHSFVFEPGALERLATCRSTITLEYEGRIHDHPELGRLQRRLFDGIGAAVVESAEGTKWETSETFAAELAKRHGDAWNFEDEPVEEEPLPISMPRSGNGERESKRLRRKLEEAINDPFANRRVATAMRAATPLVQSYAALLLEDDAQSDERAAKELKRTTEEITAARTSLEALLAAAMKD